ncbi:MAG: hypothetical protein RJB13_72, partial [Pseudomonadota bacterium]
MKPSQVFRKNILYLVRAFCFLSLVLSCTPSGIPVNGTQHCGSGRVPAQLNGLFWLLGEPASANVLCTVQNSEFLQVLVLEPDSRDPLLFEDELTGRILLIERFSG